MELAFAKGMVIIQWVYFLKLNVQDAIKSIPEFAADAHIAARAG